MRAVCKTVMNILIQLFWRAMIQALYRERQFLKTVFGFS